LKPDEQIRVLVVEDDPLMALEIKELLKKEFSAKVETAENCALARNKLSSETFEIIILDYKLPDGDGLELLEEITSTDDHPPAIMVTGHGDEEIAVGAFRLGASGYMVKDKKMRTMLTEAVKDARRKIALRRAEAELTVMNNAVALSINPIVFTDLEGRITYINDFFLITWGYDNKEEVVGKLFTQFWQNKKEAREVVEELLDTGSFRGEMIAKGKKGSTFDVEISSNIITDESGKRILIMGSFVDITERKRTERELERVNAELEGFAHMVSHDLKAPLSAILTASDKLQDYLKRHETGEDTLYLSELAVAMRRRAEMSFALIEDLLALAMGGEVMEEVSNIDVSDVVKTVLEERAGDIKEKGVEVKLDADMGRIYANHTQVYQVFSNIIGNAIEHNDKKNPIVKISSLGHEDEERAHRYLVRDNGSGIQSKMMKKIFTPFYKGKGSGTGIGLSTVDKIVKAYDGEIKAYNDNGVCFEFTIRDVQRDKD